MTDTCPPTDLRGVAATLDSLDAALAQLARHASERRRREVALSLERQEWCALRSELSLLPGTPTGLIKRLDTHIDMLDRRLEALQAGVQ